MWDFQASNLNYFQPTYTLLLFVLYLYIITLLLNLGWITGLYILRN